MQVRGTMVGLVLLTSLALQARAQKAEPAEPAGPPGLPKQVKWTFNFDAGIGAFGFGQLTGIRLPGETPGTVRSPADPGWSRVDLATNSYGQGIAVTPLQMLTAVSAVANNGVLMKPRIVRALQRGGRVEPVTPEPVRRAISEETARTLSEMMVEVLEQPALEGSRLHGYRFAGKTGTARARSGAWTHGWFVGYAPADNPEIVLVVFLEHGRGGADAAPLARDILAAWQAQRSRR